MGRGGFLSYFKSVYDLDTLDTRFTTPSGVPYKPSQQDGGRNNHGRDLGANALKDARIPPPKWKTPEFYFYLFVIAAVVPYMFWVPYEVSRRTFNRCLWLSVHYREMMRSSCAQRGL